MLSLQWNLILLKKKLKKNQWKSGSNILPELKFLSDLF